MKSLILSLVFVCMLVSTASAQNWYTTMYARYNDAYNDHQNAYYIGYPSVQDRKINMQNVLDLYEDCDDYIQGYVLVYYSSLSSGDQALVNAISSATSGWSTIISDFDSADSATSSAYNDAASAMGALGPNDDASTPNGIAATAALDAYESAIVDLEDACSAFPAQSIIDDADDDTDELWYNLQNNY